MAKKKATRKGTKDPHPEQGLLELGRVLEGGLPRGVLVRGEEHYYRERAIDLLVAAGQTAGLELARHDAADPDFDPAALLDDLSGGALFASGRLIVVRSAESLLVKGARQSLPAFVDAANAYVGRAEPGCLVLSCSKLRADHKTLKAVKAAGGPVISCRRLWDTPPPWDPDPRKTELVQWVVNRARQLKVPLKPDEAVYVAAATGNDLAALEGRLEGLRGRGPEGIRELVGWDAGGSPFTVADLLCQGDVQRSLSGIEALFQGGFDGGSGTRTVDRAAIVAMLGNALAQKARESLAGARAMAAGASPDQAWEQIGGRGGPQAKRAFASRVGLRKLRGWTLLARASGDLERRSRSGPTVDQNDFAALAVKFGVRDARGR